MEDLTGSKLVGMRIPDWVKFEGAELVMLVRIVPFVFKRRIRRRTKEKVGLALFGRSQIY